MKKTMVAAGVLIALGAVAGGVLAQARPEVLVKQRQSVMTLQGKYFGPMAAMAQGKAPYDVKIVQRNAGFLDNLSHLCARFPRTNDDQPAADRDFFSAGNEDVVFKLKKLANTRCGIRRIQRRFPNEPR